MATPKVIPTRDSRLQRGDSIVQENEDKSNTDPNVTPMKKIKREASLVMTPKGHEEIYIPKDVVFHIFTFTRRSQLVVCSQVCKLWRLLASDPYFGWCQAYLYPISQTYWGECTVEFCAGALVNVVLENQRVTDMTLQLVDGTKIGTNLQHCFSGGVMELSTMLLATEQYPKLWRRDLYKKTPVDKTKKEFYEIRFEVNVKEFEKFVFEGKEVPGRQMIIQAVSKERSDYVERNKFTAPRVPQISVMPQKQPSGFKPGVKLYKYQLDAITWMKSIEDEADEVYDFCYLTPWRAAQTTVLFDFVGPTPRMVPVSEVNNHLVQFNAKGGVLGDEMGLGKTMEMIGLILANPGTPIEDVDENKNTDDKNEEEEEDGEEEEDAEANAEVDDLFVTGATLILCPSHLVHQWTEEIEKRTNNLDIVILTTINQVKAYTYKEVKNADVVIMSYQLMKNAQYFHLGHTIKSHIKHGEEQHRQTWVNRQLRHVRKAKNPLNQKRPLCDHFYWRRIIMDEAHEIIGVHFYKTLTGALQSKFRWVVTATPFPNRYVMNSTARTLSEMKPTKVFDVYAHRKIEDTYIDFMLSNLYWRNTKGSVKDEYQIPALVEDLVLLDFTETEKIAYQYSDDTERRELCCHTGTMHAALDEFRKAFILKKENVKICAEATLIRLRSRLEEHEDRLAKAYAPYVIENIRADIKSIKESIEIEQTKIKDCGDCVKLLKAIKAYDGPKFDAEPKSLASIFEAIKPNQDGDVTMAETTTTTEKDTGKAEEEKKTKKEEGENTEETDNKIEENEAKEEKEVEGKEKKEAEDEEEKVAEDKEDRKSGTLKKENDDIDKDKDEKSEDEGEIRKEEIMKMTVAQLNKELKKRNIDAPPKALKKVLQELLISSVSTSKKANEKVNKEQEKEKEDEDDNQKDVKKEAKRYEKKEVEKMTVAQLNEALKNLGIEPPAKALKKTLQGLVLTAQEEKGKEKEEKKEEPEEISKTRSKRKFESVKEVPAKKVKKETKPKKEKKEKKEDEEVPVAKKTPLVTPNKHQKFVEAQVLKYLVERYGTKLANLIQYLRKLWADDPSARVIMFSQFNGFLNSIASVLADNDIESAFVEGNIMRRERALKSFKKSDSEVRVLLMSLQSAASGSNLIAATHIILMDPVKGTKKEALATEQQAIGRAHRQGQEKQVTIVRFIVKKTIEYDTYVQNYLTDESLSLKENKDRPKLLHGNNIDSVLATTPSVRRSKSIIELVANLQ